MHKIEKCFWSQFNVSYRECNGKVPGNPPRDYYSIDSAHYAPRNSLYKTSERKLSSFRRFLYRFYLVNYLINKHFLINDFFSVYKITKGLLLFSFFCVAFDDGFQF